MSTRRDRRAHRHPRALRCTSTSPTRPSSSCASSPRASPSSPRPLAVAGPDPAQLAAAYRAWAVAHAELYALMTAEPLPLDRLPPGLEAAAADPLLSAFGDEHVARAPCASAHGLVTLELARRFPPEADLDAAWAAMVAAYAPFARYGRISAGRCGWPSWPSARARAWRPSPGSSTARGARATRCSAASRRRRRRAAGSSPCGRGSSRIVRRPLGLPSRTPLELGDEARRRLVAVARGADVEAPGVRVGAALGEVAAEVRAHRLRQQDRHLGLRARALDLRGEQRRAGRCCGSRRRRRGRARRAAARASRRGRRMAAAYAASRAARRVAQKAASCSPSGVEGGAAVEVLRAERGPVGAGAQLAEHGEHEPLHAADQQRLRRDGLPAHLLEVSRARRGGALHQLGDVARARAA